MPIENARRRGWGRVVLSLIVLPSLMGAKADGCSYGGDVPIGSGSPDAAASCSAADCAGLPVQNDARICPDGTAIGRSVCAQSPLGCRWDFAPCPEKDGGGQCGPVCDIYCRYGNVLDGNRCPTCRCNPAPDSGASCTLQDCEGQPRDNDARGCPDGTVLERSACAKGPNGACGWDFPPCPASDGGVADGGKCGPVCTIFCEYGNVLDASGCPTCACNPAPCGASGQGCCATSADRGPCDGELLCCVGVPYPDGGVCQMSCLAK
jgi:hypothetical protein